MQIQHEDFNSGNNYMLATVVCINVLTRRCKFTSWRSSHKSISSGNVWKDPVIWMSTSFRTKITLDYTDLATTEPSYHKGETTCGITEALIDFMFSPRPTYNALLFLAVLVRATEKKHQRNLTTNSLHTDDFCVTLMVIFVFTINVLLPVQPLCVFLRHLQQLSDPTRSCKSRYQKCWMLNSQQFFYCCETGLCTLNCIKMHPLIFIGHKNLHMFGFNLLWTRPQNKYSQKNIDIPTYITSNL